MHTVTNTYILHLAVADECFLVGIPFLIATMTMRQWPFGMTMCKIYFTTTSINQITSSLFLMVLSADRYVAVCHPISSPRFRTGIIAKIVSLSVWLISGNMSFIAHCRFVGVCFERVRTFCAPALGSCLGNSIDIRMCIIETDTSQTNAPDSF